MKKTYLFLIFFLLIAFFSLGKIANGASYMNSSDRNNILAIIYYPMEPMESNGDMRTPPDTVPPDDTPQQAPSPVSGGAQTANSPTDTGITSAGASAANGTGGGFTDFKTAVKTLTSYVNLLIPFLIGLGVLFFIWGLLKYITAGGDETKLAEAKKFIVFGVVGLAVMISVWGLVNLVVSTFFPSTGMFLPQIKT